MDAWLAPDKPLHAAACAAAALATYALAARRRAPGPARLALAAAAGCGAGAAKELGDWLSVRRAHSPPGRWESRHSVEADEVVGLIRMMTTGMKRNAVGLQPGIVMPTLRQASRTTRDTAAPG